MWKPHAVSNTQAVIVDKWTSITKIPEVEISSPFILLIFLIQFAISQMASFKSLAFLAGSGSGSAAGLVSPNSASPFLFPLPFPFSLILERFHEMCDHLYSRQYSLVQLLELLWPASGKRRPQSHWSASLSNSLCSWSVLGMLLGEGSLGH